MQDSHGLVPTIIERGKITMKKTLAIVLALVMVLAMIPAMSAHTTEYKTVTDKSYTLEVISTNDNGKEAAPYGASATKANTVEFKYVWSDLKADTTGRYSDDVVMGQVKINGWDAELVAGTTKSVTVDGKVLVEDAADGWIVFPVELTKAGYTDTFVVTVVAENGDKQITETAKVSIKLVNTETYKAEKTATISNIKAVDGTQLSAYIVGSKIYLDYVDNAAAAEVKITFADENGKAFTGKVWATQITGKQIWLPAGEVVLKDSAAVYAVTGADDTKIKFTLDAAAADYATKEYAIVAREYVQEEDPKGIYFAETVKSIAMGEKYTPVVVGVKTGKPVAAELFLGVYADAQVIDLIGTDTVIGTREGVAYVTATYTTNAYPKNTYLATAMKIIVTLPGESIPAVDPAAEVYYVTCRALNVRAGAGTSYKKVDLIHRGDAVKVVELKNGWAKLDNGTYVCAKYIAK